MKHFVKFFLSDHSKSSAPRVFWPFSTNFDTFRNFNLSFFGLPVGMIAKIFAQKRYILTVQIIILKNIYSDLLSHNNNGGSIIARSLIVILAKNKRKNFTKMELISAPRVPLCPTNFFKSFDLTSQGVYFSWQIFCCKTC